MTMNKNTTKSQMIYFILVGGLATLSNFSVAWLTLKIFSLHETIAVIIGYFVAFWVSYIGHRFLTFQKAANPLKFLMLSLSMLALYEILILFFTNMLHIRGFWAIVIPLSVVTTLTFIISKYKVFKN